MNIVLKSIKEVCEYIYSFINLEKNENYNTRTQNIYSLDNVKCLLKYFNNPEQNQNIIHIAGTKGKGSVSILISHLLNLLNITTTTFLSPHLVNINERFLYNLDSINDKELISLTNFIKKIISKNNLNPTVFELLFILYLLFSKNKKSDYFVVETGIGGRLDCTNIVDPVISVITPISIDHTNVLGKTINKITYEKGGIIKNNKNVVLGKQRYISHRILKKIAYRKKSKIYETNKLFRLLSYKPSENGMIFDFKFKEIIIKDFFISLLGVHQIYNFFTALQTVYLIDPEILNIIRNKGSININIPGRIQILQKNPLVILDVAHNNDSAKKLKKTLLFHYPGLKWIVLSGMSIGKDHKNFYKKIKGIIDKLIITSPSLYKDSFPENVYKQAKISIKNILFIPFFDKAFNRALSFNKPLLITGSFYIAGPFFEKWKRLKI